MSRFAIDWLALREPLDARSRSGPLAEQLAADAPRGTRYIIDLATGSGANLRYLAPRLSGLQDWLLIDNDEALLEAVERQLRHWAIQRGLTLQEHGDSLILRGQGLHCRAHRRLLDLATHAQQLGLDECWLVTASALLDLVAQRCLDDLVTRCRRAGAGMLFALTYDGLMQFSPRLPEDSRINVLVNRHQSRDKGFGPALGPRAAWIAPAMARRHGYDVTETDSPWRLDPAQTALQVALLEGCVQAAVEVAPSEVHWILRWRQQRRQYIAAGISHVSVGHRDLLAWPVKSSNADEPANPGS